MKKNSKDYGNVAVRPDEQSLQICDPAYLVPVPSLGKLGGLRQEGHLA